MIQEKNNWFYYKKIISWLTYFTLAIIGIFIVYYSVDYFFTKTFQSRGIQYESYKASYTSEPGTDPGLVDKDKWKKKSADRGWSLQMLNAGYIHYVVALTIAFTLIIAIIGGVIVFRNQTKHSHR